MKFKNIKIQSIITILLISLLFLFAGCSNSIKDKSESCDDGSFCSISENQENIVEEKELESTNEEIDNNVKIELPEEIITLQEKAKKINSYEFLDHETGRGILKKGEQYIIIGDKTDKFIAGGYEFNTIIINYEKNEAFATCMNWNKYNIKCNEDASKRKYTKVTTDIIEKPVNPFDELMKLTNAEVDGTIGCGDQTCYKIKYTKDNNNYIMLARSFFAMPYEIKEIDSEGVKVSSIRYDNVAFNHLKDEDFEIPEDFELVGEVIVKE